MLVATLIGSLILELVINLVPALWKIRKLLAAALIIGLAFCLGVVLASQTTILGALCSLVILYRLINLFRIVKARMHEAYLRRATRRTSLMLAILQLLTLGGLIWSPTYRPLQLQFLVLVECLAAILFFVFVLRNIYKSRHVPALENYADKELPTVSVCIPARNETVDLEECLTSLLASDYSKLEILVLDDCSQSTKTPEIVRDFAQAGVRFIQGEEPKDRWLAKNQAYDRLAKQATGELVLFCGVDVRFGSKSVRALVTTLLARKKAMVSILPHSISPSPWAALIQPMRYWWELVPPRRYFNRPPVLSTCWIIKKQELEQLGGFEAVSHAIIPERYFARELVKEDGYTFLRSDQLLEITSSKQPRDQFATAVRMRYPQIRRRPELALVLTLTEFIFLLMPFIIAAIGLWISLPAFVMLLALLSCIFLIATHIAIVIATNPASLAFSLINFPFIVLLEIFLGNYSMFRYEFSTVDWKGRNICIPVMHVIPRLPNV